MNRKLIIASTLTLFLASTANATITPVSDGIRYQCGKPFDITYTSDKFIKPESNLLRAPKGTQILQVSDNAIRISSLTGAKASPSNSTRIFESDIKDGEITSTKTVLYESYSYNGAIPLSDINLNYSDLNIEKGDDFSIQRYMQEFAKNYTDYPSKLNPLFDIVITINKISGPGELVGGWPDQILRTSETDKGTAVFSLKIKKNGSISGCPMDSEESETVHLRVNIDAPEPEIAETPEPETPVGSSPQSACLSQSIDINNGQPGSNFIFRYKTRC